MFNRTGVGHLMSISGSHIGLIAVYARAGLDLVGWDSALALRWPATRAPRWLLCWEPAAIPCFQDCPFRPAFIDGGGRHDYGQGSASRRLQSHSGAGAAGVLVDPGAPLQVDFGHSPARWQRFFTASAGAGVNGDRWVRRSACSSTSRWRCCRRPWCSSSNSLILSPLANLIAIPWVGCTVLPLSVLAALLETAGGAAAQALPLELAALTMGWLWHILFWLDQWPGMVLYRPAPPLWTLAFALPGLALLPAPRSLPGRLSWACQRCVCRCCSRRRARRSRGLLVHPAGRGSGWGRSGAHSASCAGL